MNTQTNNIPRETKGEQLKQVVQSSKLINLRYNLSEIALIANISRSTVNSKVKEIEDYWSEPSNTPDEDKKFLLERSIEIGLGKIPKGDKQVSEHILGIILGTYLKVGTDLLDDVDSLKRVWTIGQNIVKIHGRVCKYKNEYAYIHSVNDSYAKYLLDSRMMNQTSLNQLFIRTNKYLKDQYTKKWSSTELLKRYINISNDKYLNIISKSCIPVQISLSESLPHMLRKKCANQAMTQEGIKYTISNKAPGDTKGYFFKVNTDYIYTILRAKINTIEQFEPSSKVSLLTQAVSISDDEIHVPIRHKAKGSEYLGRTYNVFCSLRSKERLDLGYISYDMSAAMQSICLHLIKAKREEYPELWAYAHDKEHKRKMRKDVAKALGIEETAVKKKLTAFANGSTKGIKHHSYYAVFQEESARLRKATLEHVARTEPDVLKRAKEQSRKLKEYPEELDWLDTESEETSREARVKSSVFFFVWTWYERKIRQAMLELLHDGIEVHDAVYSKIDISAKDVEYNIRNFAGFDIGIEKEMP